MSFIDGIYRFTVNVNDSNRNLYDTVTFRTPKHPHETLQHLVARVLACSHSYVEGLEFSEGLFSPEDPAIWKKSVIDIIEIWIDVGAPDKKKLQKALRAGTSSAIYRVYFYDPDHVEQMANHLKGSRSNWIERFSFYKIAAGLVEDLSEILHIRNEWSLTIIDSTVYLSCGDRDFTGTITHLNMWESFQNIIANV